ncbi:MAG: hypothetical protein KBD78_14190, partial [Oligoflexales bacterium]|nr:hypothetical protein [Oligoflexales bacterium]
RGSEHLLNCSPIKDFNEPGAECNGWILDNVLAEFGGVDYSIYGNAKVIVRINHSWNPAEGGTLDYSNPEAFCNKVALYAKNSTAAHYWIIGNEPNLAIEGPNRVVDPIEYAKIFVLCRNAIRAEKGHESDIVLPAAVATFAPDVAGGAANYLKYHHDLLAEILKIDENAIDGITIHAKTINCNTGDSACFSEAKENFEEFINIVKQSPQAVITKRVPIFLTEANPHGSETSWTNSKNWISYAYDLVNAYNQTNPPNKVHAMFIYRWDNGDSLPQYNEYEFIGLESVEIDFRNAVKKGYLQPDQFKVFMPTVNFQ